MFPQILRSTQLDTPCLYQSRKTKRATIVCFLKTDYKARAQTFPQGQHCCDPMQTGAILLHTLRRSQNKRNVGTCCAKSLTDFKLYATSTNKCQNCLRFHANGRHIFFRTMLRVVGQQCCVRLYMESQQCWQLLALVARSLKPVELSLGPCKRTQHC